MNDSFFFFIGPDSGALYCKVMIKVSNLRYLAIMYYVIVIMYVNAMHKAVITNY
jgi:hypothetical protein